MSTEVRKHLRQYCEMTSCAIWSSICKQKNNADKNVESSLRKYCSAQCKAYQYNRWLYTVNKDIVNNEGSARYK